MSPVTRKVFWVSGLIPMIILFVGMNYVGPRFEKTGLSIAAGFENHDIAKATLEENVVGPHTLIFNIPEKAGLTIAPVKVESLSECFDAAKAEVKKRLDAGRNGVPYRPVCINDENGVQTPVE